MTSAQQHASNAAIRPSPEALKPYPKAGPRKAAQERRKRKSAILTDTPIKEQLEEEKKKQKMTKK
uniref:Uncharacterized protein n=1 Tax=Anguilla anguilla TaxID=7936 RepID=A0A0E9SC25_ANGAN